MTCDLYHELMSRFLDEDLTPPEVRIMEEHLSRCEGCAAMLRDMRATRDLMNRLTDPAIPAEIHEGAMARIRAEASRRKRVRILSWAGAAAALVICVVGASSMLHVGMSFAPPMETSSAAYDTNAYAGGEWAVDSGSMPVPLPSAAPAAAPDAGWLGGGMSASQAESGVYYEYETAPPSPAGPPVESGGGTLRGTADASMPMPSVAPDSGGTMHGIKIERGYYLLADSWAFDDDMAAITASLEAIGGYFESREISGVALGQPNGYGRYASMNMRVPIASLDAFIGDVRGVGRVTQFNEYATDITDQYYDTQARLEAYQAELDKLEDLLRSAESVEDILNIHNAMTDLQYQIDMLTGQIGSMDGRVSYATVTLSLRETEEPDTIRTATPTLGERIRTGFIDAVNNVLAFLSSALVAVIAGVPIWVPFAALAAAAWLIIRRIIKKKRRDTR